MKAQELQLVRRETATKLNQLDEAIAALAPHSRKRRELSWRTIFECSSICSFPLSEWAVLVRDHLPENFVIARRIKCVDPSFDELVALGRAAVETVER